MGTYSVFPTGTTIYDKNKAWNGYTVYHSFDGALVMDMNGNVVHLWKGLNGSPNRMLPGGRMIGTLHQPVIAQRFEEDGTSLPLPDLDQEEMVVADWDGRIVWRRHMPQHHDYQIEGSTVGYPAPGTTMNAPDGHRMLVLENRIAPVSDMPENMGQDARGNRISASGEYFIDDCITEYDAQGNKVWHWNALDHIREMGLSEEALEVIRGVGSDWCHLNAISYIGPNRFADAGDEIFNPENILASSRELSLVFIIRKKDGKIIWKMGPEETAASQTGLIIGQHHAHIIPKGLPGEGNLLLFDNGGFAGYGTKNLFSPDGRRVLRRHYSRVLEVNPQTWDVVWEYRYDDLDITASGLFSPLLGSAQRLPNGNTLVTEGCFGRIMEITKDKEVVWEYVGDQISPFKIMGSHNIIYRAYRVPYDYLPFLDKPEEVSLPKIDCFHYHVPGSIARDLRQEDVVNLN